MSLPVSNKNFALLPFTNASKNGRIDCLVVTAATAKAQMDKMLFTKLLLAVWREGDV